MMKVEVLFFEGCPNHQPAVQRVRNVLADEGVCAEVVQIEVPDQATAESLSFLGSPSVRINGIDVEGTIAPKAVGFSCRVYMQGSVREGVPPVEVIRCAVRKAKESSR